jgi:hypothetical protein
VAAPYVEPLNRDLLADSARDIFFFGAPFAMLPYVVALGLGMIAPPGGPLPFLGGISVVTIVLVFAAWQHWTTFGLNHRGRIEGSSFIPPGHWLRFLRSYPTTTYPIGEITVVALYTDEDGQRCAGILVSPPKLEWSFNARSRVRQEFARLLAERAGKAVITSAEEFKELRSAAVDRYYDELGRKSGALELGS